MEFHLIQQLFNPQSNNVKRSLCINFHFHIYNIVSFTLYDSNSSTIRYTTFATCMNTRYHIAKNVLFYICISHDYITTVSAAWCLGLQLLFAIIQLPTEHLKKDNIEQRKRKDQTSVVETSIQYFKLSSKSYLRPSWEPFSVKPDTNNRSHFKTYILRL